MKERTLLAHVASSRGFPADEATLDRLLAYRDLLLEVGQRKNLTAARTPAAALDAVVLSALAVVAAPMTPPSRIVDLGTGNGMPGLAAHLAWPAAHVWLVERRAGKAEAVREIVERLGLPRVDVVTADGRELLGHRPELRGAVDLVTARAVGTLAAVNRLAAPWVAAGGTVAHFKGAGLDAAELAAGAQAAPGLAWAETRIFDDDAGPHRLVIYRRET